MDSSIVILIIIVLLVLYSISIYNQLVNLKNRMLNLFSQIDVQLKRRYDLIPNLVNVAKEYMSHERETLEAVINARNKASSVLNSFKDNLDGQSMNQLMSAENNLKNAMGGLNFVMEAYPELKANQNMMQLSEELSSTENKIAFARQAFNDSVMEYNIYKQSFPQVILAGSFGHRQDGILLEFENKEELAKVPTINFN